MLSKLIKHEWKRFWKVPAGVCAFLILYTLIGSITFYTPLWDSSYGVVRLILILGSISYIFVLMAPLVVLYVFIGYRFYQNFYTDEGYLMHTLPVTKNQLILSKTIVAFIWSLIAALVTGLSIFLLILMISTSARYGQLTFGEFFGDLYHSMKLIIPEFEQIFGVPFWLFTLICIVLFLISCLYSVLLIFGCMSVGHLWKKHPVAGGILAYVGMNILMQILSLILVAGNITRFLPYADQEAGFEAAYRSYMFSTLADGAIVNLIGIVLFYFITHLILSRKLNLN